ncbi:MAG: hypothetical protein MJA30_02320 [Cytophagales bacterium]|nr:hypothetical protein [Cytophagales bacterium]
MKKVVIILLVAGVVVGTGAYLAYRYYLPKMVAKTIVSEEVAPSILPAKVQESIQEVKAAVDAAEAEDIPAQLTEVGLTFDDIIHMVEVAEADQVFSTIEELQNTELHDLDQVFDIGLKHIKIEGYDLSVFREPFKEKATMKRVHKALRKIEENDLLVSVSVPVARETVKQILIEKRDKVEATLK